VGIGLTMILTINKTFFVLGMSVANIGIAIISAGTAFLCWSLYREIRIVSPNLKTHPVYMKNNKIQARIMLGMAIFFLFVCLYYLSGVMTPIYNIITTVH
jgi:hypothetical protein